MSDVPDLFKRMRTSRWCWRWPIETEIMPDEARKARAALSCPALPTFPNRSTCPVRPFIFRGALTDVRRTAINADM